jgi:hypothetical protein
MEKYKLINLVKKTSRSFRNQSPTGIYRLIITDNSYEPLSYVLKAKDLVIFSLLVPRFHMGSDIDEDYDRIEFNMFSVELVEVYDSEPELDCPECNDGHVNCDNCDGTGEIECDRCDNTGQVDCSSCGGDGVDDEGEECSECEGMGKESCNYCYGSGYESCNYCGGDGDNICPTCDGEGKKYSKEKSEVIYSDFISWSGRWKLFFSNIKQEEQIDREDSDNFLNNNQTLLLKTYYEMSEEYEGYENGDTFLFKMNEKPEIITRDKEGIVRI